MSFGGQIVRDGRPYYRTDAARAAFELIATLFNEELAFMNPPRTFGDQTAFGNDEIAFSFRPSSSLPYYKLVKEGTDGWGVARLPQKDPASPATVLYGANVSVFNASPEHVTAAWEFLKYFNTPEVNARWAVATGYLPSRKSATEQPVLQKFWSEWQYNRVAFDCLDFARSEPNLAGWQTIRSMLENAATEIATGMSDPEAALDALQGRIDAEYAGR
jgi:ABC-type glycerol-3-phosphate transport system substrate-binding protein